MANRRFIDFPIAASVGDNDIVLIWQDGLNKQTTKATLLQGSPQSLAGLTDVDIAGLTNGQILQYNSTLGKWENVDRTDINLSELGDVTIVAPTNGQVLVYNSSTSKWENSSGGYVPYTGAVTTVNLGAQSILAGSFVKAGGTSSQFLKADGSVDSTAYGTGSVTSVALTMPTAFNVANSPVTTAGTLAVTGAGTVAQYIRGDGSLADFPATTGGGASVSYYLNGSVSQGTIGGVAYREVNRNPVFGAGTDITINSNGYIANFITDAGDPNKLLIPAGNWNFETYFSASSGGGSPTFYVELYKYDGTTFTLIATSSGTPELIAFGTNINPYFSTLAVPETVLALTDRLAVRFYVTHSGRTITLHTENGHLCQVITTFTTGLTALNGLTTQVQFFAVGTSGSDFNIASSVDTHTFNLPTASATNRGALSSADWTIFNGKENAITAGTTAQYFRGDKTFQTLNTAAVPELTNLYYTEARVNANTNVAANTAARHNAVTLGTANGLSLSTQVLSLGLASAGVTGALSGTDWSTFNSKQNALTNPVTGTGTTNYLPKFTGSTTIGNSNLINDANGNLGLGVTPSAWGGISGKVLEIGYSGGNAAFFQNGADDFWTTSNGNFNSGWKYIKTGTATAKLMSSGNHYWFTAPSGTAGNALTWTQAMTLTSGGNLLVGTTTDNGAKFQVAGSASFTGNVLMGFNNALRVGDSPYRLSIYRSSAGNLITYFDDEYDVSNTSIRFRMRTSGTPIEALTIASSGNVGIGATAPNRLLTVSGTQGLIALNATSYRNTTIGSDSVGNFIVYDDTAAAYRMVINSSGNVGFNTTTPTTYSLSGSHIENFGGGSFAFIHNNTTTVKSFYATNESAGLSVLYTFSNHPLTFGTNNTERARITSGGNLLVGTTTDAGFKLDVNGTGRFSNQITGPSGAVNEGKFNFIGYNNGYGGITANTGFDSSYNSVILYSNFNSNRSGQGNTSIPSWQLDLGGSFPNQDSFSIYRSAAGSFTFTNLFKITSGGNVGIGTNTFAYSPRLAVASVGQNSIAIQTTDTVQGSTGTILYIGTGTSTGNSTYGIIRALGNGGTAATNLVIQESGNLLIGTTTDVGARLHVNGAVRTGAPSGGSAVDWRLGTARGGTITPNAIVRVEIGGVLVDLDARYV